MATRIIWLIILILIMHIEYGAATTTTSLDTTTPSATTTTTSLDTTTPSATPTTTSLDTTTPSATTATTSLDTTAEIEISPSTANPATSTTEELTTVSNMTYTVPTTVSEATTLSDTATNSEATTPPSQTTHSGTTITPQIVTRDPNSTATTDATLPTTASTALKTTPTSEPNNFTNAELNGTTPFEDSTLESTTAIVGDNTTADGTSDVTSYVATEDMHDNVTHSETTLVLSNHSTTDDELFRPTLPDFNFTLDGNFTWDFENITLPDFIRLNTTSTSTTTTATTPDVLYCYRCDSREGGQEQKDCLGHWHLMNDAQHASYRIPCETGYCVKMDYLLRNTTTSRRQVGTNRIKPIDRRFQVIVRDCATQDDLGNLPNNPEPFLENGGCKRSVKYEGDRPVEQCFCEFDNCNHSNILTIHVIMLSMTFVVAAIFS